MLDITAVTKNENLRNEQQEFEKLGFHRRDVWVDTDEKPYIGGSLRMDGNLYNINIHICRNNDLVHRDSLLFIEALNKNAELRKQYEKIKDRAHAIDPINSEVYNKEKSKFIETVYRGFREPP